MPILVSLLLAAQPAKVATPYIAPPPIITPLVAPPPIAVTNSLPPPVVAVSGPPLIRVNPINAIGEIAPSLPAVLDIKVSGEGGLLWQGSLRVGPSASYTEQRAESPVGPCAGVSSYDHTIRTSLSLNVSKYRSDRVDQFTVGVGWSRPGDTRSCTDSATRSVQLQQTFELAPGAETVLRGDGGLAVQIRRR